MTVKTETKVEAILRIFRGLGRRDVLLDDVTAKCIEEGLWGPHDRERMFRRACNREVRSAITKDDEQGLPTGLSVETVIDGEKIHYYVQRPLWEPLDLDINIRAKARQIQGDKRRLMRLVAHAEERYPGARDWQALAED